MAIELATAYVSIVPETSKIAPAIKKEFGGIDKAAAKVGQTSGKQFADKFKSVKLPGEKIVGTLGKAIKGGVIGIGAAAGGLLGTALFKGFDRLKGIDEAKAKLSGLGHSAKSVDAIMKNALASVKGTAFGLDEAATTAAGAVAAGVKPGKDLTRNLKLVADAATIAGTDMGSMGAIFNKVAASDMIQGDVLAQLGDQGIPILQLLSKQLGVSAADVRKMASEGKVDFKTFQKAMQEGMGGAALKSGKTFSGSLENMKAALGRLGASVLGGVFSKMPGVFTNLTGSLDKLGPAAERVGAKLGEGVGNVVRFFSQMKAGEGTPGRIGAALEKFGAITANVVGFLASHKSEVSAFISVLAGFSILRSITVSVIAFNAALAANPIGLVVVGLAALAAGLVYAYKRSETFRKIVSGAFVGVIGAVVGLMKMWAKMLRGLSKVPGFGWAKKAADGMDKAARSASNLAAKIKGVKPKTVKVGANVFGGKQIDSLTQKIAGVHNKQVTIAANVAVRGAQKIVNGVFGGARAAGGPVSANRDYLVGERGPELFRPPSSGRIIPNHKLKASPSAVAGGGGGRQAITITNWQEGTGYIETVADRRVGAARRLDRQTMGASR